MKEVNEENLMSWINEAINLMTGLTLEKIIAYA